MGSSLTRKKNPQTLTRRQVVRGIIIAFPLVALTACSSQSVTPAYTLGVGDNLTLPPLEEYKEGISASYKVELGLQKAEDGMLVLVVLQQLAGKKDRVVLEAERKITIKPPQKKTYWWKSEALFPDGSRIEGGLVAEVMKVGTKVLYLGKLDPYLIIQP
ncbi:MAG: hypothetical protein GXN92_03540 [Candidatus Micrarchaeota archaeon]|nr:hypothetical protein [Candidatus Micrarchaeota archaeon]